MPELTAILAEFSAAIQDPSPDSDEKMKQLLINWGQSPIFPLQCEHNFATLASDVSIGENRYDY